MLIIMRKWGVMMERMIQVIYSVFIWMVRLSFLNILWILFTMLGFIIFGIGPATTSVFAVVRKWIMSSDDVPIFRTFWKSYRSEFKHSNIISLLLTFIGVLLYIHYFYLTRVDGLILNIMMFGFLSMLIIYLLVLVFIFPVIAHFHLKLIQYIKYAVILSFSFPHISFFMFVAIIAHYLIIVMFPAYLPFFSVSTLSFSIMWLAKQAFSKINSSSI
ncbi:DUF624 domain-containing protein [Gracilibacillus salitolerans]|uniref:DUF624 domain-containing protein n=1 Tax=Gracilibacillus salitolerans TaxID=2663022 RepID=A0A5Q2TPE5_9BACI|nr:DUF624 domain-containing protein [Gracilibacillus salitolerans]QGH35982.1 DUF624 domain-containing protein [Gracilibacillus salitolerans]